MSEECFYRSLARAIGAEFLDGAFRLDPAIDHRTVLSAGAGRLGPGRREDVVAAPRGHSIARLLAAAPGLAAIPAITTPTRLRDAVYAQHAEPIAEAASDGLARHRPDWSCRPGARPVDLALAGLAILLVIVLTNSSGLLGLALLAAIQIVLLAMLAFRIAAASVPAAIEAGAEGRRLPDGRLPSYTVLIALYREARVAPRLIHALAKLDYPAAKLQVVFLIEADDSETAAAFRAAPMPARFEVLVVPPGLPRTKPRALNAALPIVRGDLLVVYDAEDVVDPAQLRIAANRFARMPGEVACLQGRLVIDNAGDGWLQRLFALEYSGLFDVLGPALSAWRMPLPLGGTSTHFRTRILRDAMRGWDAWNVTEDADLGLRLARAGYRVGDLPSATYEEAPTTIEGWLRQRTRWMKGFLQTSVTHGRDPIATYRDLGPLGSLCALTLLPGTVVSALVYPMLMPLAAWSIAMRGPPSDHILLSALTGGGAILVFLSGLAGMMLPAACGCLRRGWGDLRWVPLLPLYFLLVSAAAWLAVFELARHPHRWNKTEHGLSRTSRSGALHLRRKGGATGASTGPPRPLAAAV